MLVLVWIMASAIVILGALLANSWAKKDHDTQEVIGRLYGFSKTGSEDRGWREFRIDFYTGIGTNRETYLMFASKKDYDRAWEWMESNRRPIMVRVRFVQSVEDVVWTNEAPADYIFGHAKTIELLDEE